MQAAREAGQRSNGPTSAEAEELSRLRAENRQLREECGILAKGRGLPSDIAERDYTVSS